MSNKKGEIATILTVSSLVFLGAVSLISSIFLGKISTTKTKASEDCNQMANRSCVNYAPNAQRNTQKKDATGACNPACCECDEQCSNGQKCDIPNGYCQSGFSCNPSTQKKLTCVSGQCVWQPCQGDDCNRNTCTSHSQCQNQLVSPTSTDRCFNIKADIEVRPEGEKKSFYVWVNFNSSKGGDIKLEYNGIQVAGWDRFGGGNFTYSPQWTQPHTHNHEAGIAALANNQSIQFTYRGMHSGCTPQDVTISCSAGVSQDGRTWISGTGCQCRNCNTSLSPTVARTPTPPRKTTPTSTPTPTITSPEAPTLTQPSAPPPTPTITSPEAPTLTQPSAPPPTPTITSPEAPTPAGTEALTTAPNISLTISTNQGKDASIYIFDANSNCILQSSSNHINLVIDQLFNIWVKMEDNLLVEINEPDFTNR